MREAAASPPILFRRPLGTRCGKGCRGGRGCGGLGGLGLAMALARSDPPTPLPRPSRIGETMLLAIPNVLTPETAAQLREAVLAGDGAADGGEAEAAAQAEITAALMDSAAFLSAALPHTVLPPLFTRYRAGEAFCQHADSAIRHHARTGARIRTDLACTLFLSDPADYAGGELEIHGRFGKASYRLPAGHMLLYPTSHLHRVTPITRGERIAGVFWLQSLVAEHAAREMLYDLDQSVQKLAIERGREDAEVLRLTAIYHTLVRRWAEA